MTLLPGSTDALPPLRGLAYVPTTLGVALNTRSRLPPVARLTVPLAVALSLLLLIAALTVPLTPDWLVTVTDPYVRPLVASWSSTNVCRLLKSADALPLLATWIVPFPPLPRSVA